ncbi:MAG: ABC transporter permease [Saprospiraceae bacterium]
MLTNYLKIALRNLHKQRFYAGINILGLSIGVACCLLISLFVWDELGYDRYNEKADRIYRVNSDINFGGKHETYAVAQAPLAAALRDEVPEVETACRFRQWGSRLLRREGTTQNFNEEKITWADNEIFDVFTLPLVGGEKAALLTEPNTIVISQSAAKRHFGEVNPVGQNMIIDNQTPVKVTGVFKDIPRASHFHYDFFLSMAGLEEAQSPVWLSHNFNTYVVIKPGADPREIDRKIEALFKKYAAPQVKMAIGATLEELEAQGSWARYTLFPATDIHLKSSLVAEHEANSDVAYVWIFSAIALFILLIACINFMNLATARSANRAKEVGMRKVLGSVKQQLVGQFLTEAILMSAIAFSLAILIGEMAMPYFNQLTNKELEMPFGHIGFFGLLVAGALLVGMMAGSYPAFYLSAFRPIEVLKGKLKSNMSSGWLRHSLVVFQFAISMLLLVGTAVIYRQLNFIQNKRLGFDKEQVLLLGDAGSLGEKFEGFKNSLEALPEVKSTTSTCYLPVNSCRSDNTVWIDGKSRDQYSLQMQCWWVDDHYLSTLGMEMVDGRFFSKDFATDSAATVINETAVKKFGFENPIGQKIDQFDDISLQTYRTYTVVGVIKDFNYESLRENVGPLGFFFSPKQKSNLAIRFDATTDIGPLIDKIRREWDAVTPGLPFDYNFLDDRFRRMYESEQRLGNIFIVFAGLAIFIACLGLLALAAFTAERRTKEIGVRKVLGATTGNIFVLLTSEFTKWVLVASLIAIPLSWWGAVKWLENFAYRSPVSWWVFALALGVALTVALLTVSLQALRAAWANPVESLRSE